MCDELPKPMTVRRINLLKEPLPVKELLDAICCRTVMIYFDKPIGLKIQECHAPLLPCNDLPLAEHSKRFRNAVHFSRLKGKTAHGQVAEGTK